MAETGFSAKKEIPADEVDVKNGRPVITPSTKDAEGKKVPATVNLGIAGVVPIKLTDVQETAFWKWLTPIAGEAPNLKDVSPTVSAITP